MLEQGRHRQRGRPAPAARHRDRRAARQPVPGRRGDQAVGRVAAPAQAPGPGPGVRLDRGVPRGGRAGGSAGRRVHRADRPRRRPEGVPRHAGDRELRAPAQAARTRHARPDADARRERPAACQPPGRLDARTAQVVPGLRPAVPRARPAGGSGCRPGLPGRGERRRGAAAQPLAAALPRQREGERMALWLLEAGGERRLARGPAGEGPQELLTASLTIDALLAVPDSLATELRGPSAGPVPPGARIVAPIGGQEVWAAGVTYTRSRDARVLESGTPDPYERAYLAERPELFLKAAPGRVRGPGEPVGIREDSGWDVPEPELAVVADSGGHIVGYLNGNDMSSRSIEGENPLYLPQAKIYTGSCAVGPCLATPEEVPGLAALLISLLVVRDGATVISDTVKVGRASCRERV